MAWLMRRITTDGDTCCVVHDCAGDEVVEVLSYAAPDRDTGGDDRELVDSFCQGSPAGNVLECVGKESSCAGVDAKLSYAYFLDHRSVAALRAAAKRLTMAMPAENGTLGDAASIFIAPSFDAAVASRSSDRSSDPDLVPFTVGGAAQHDHPNDAKTRPRVQRHQLSGAARRRMRREQQS